MKVVVDRRALRTLYQQGFKSRQNSCQVQPTENIKNLSVSKRCICLGTEYSFYCLECCQCFRIGIISYRKDCIMCCPTNKVIKSLYSDAFAHAAVPYQAVRYSFVYQEPIAWRLEEALWRDFLDTTKLTA